MQVHTRVCRPSSAASVPTAWQLENRGTCRKGLMSPPRARFCRGREKRWNPRWSLTLLPEAARSPWEASLGRKPTGPPRRVPDRGLAICNSGFALRAPALCQADAASLLGHGEKLPAAKNEQSVQGPQVTPPHPESAEQTNTDLLQRAGARAGGGDTSAGALEHLSTSRYAIVTACAASDGILGI